MEGIPDAGLTGALVAAALITTWILLVPRRQAPDRGWRFDVLKLPGARRAVSSRWFQPVFQALPLVLFVAVVVSGLYGTPVPERNLATVLTWGIWWVLLIVDIVLLGRMWCMVCPWEAIAGFLRRGAVVARTSEPMALERKWPGWLRNVYPATLLFVGLTWLELGYGVTFSPRATAWMGIAMVFLAVLPALVYEKRAFCKYACLVGRICGLYSMLAPVEVRAADPEACKDCRSKDCLMGNDRGYPCPTAQYPARMESNAYCTVCTECVKTCPKENIAWNLRPWGADLSTLAKPRRDEALLAVVMLAMTSFHGLTMTPVWNRLLEEGRRQLGLGPLAGFSIGMLFALVLPVLVFGAVASAAARLGAIGPNRGRFTAALAYPMVAVALLYHLAHNAGHFLVEGARIVPVLSDPMGRGWDLFGTAGFAVAPIFPMEWIWVVQIALVLIGHWAATRAAVGMTDRFGDGEDRDGAAWLASLLVLAFTAMNLWLLAQPMEMRSGL